MQATALLAEDTESSGETIDATMLDNLYSYGTKLRIRQAIHLAADKVG